MHSPFSPYNLFPELAAEVEAAYQNNLEKGLIADADFATTVSTDGLKEIVKYQNQQDFDEEQQILEAIDENQVATVNSQMEKEQPILNIDLNDPESVKKLHDLSQSLPNHSDQLYMDD